MSQGGQKPAKVLVKDFLGREPDNKAFFDEITWSTGEIRGIFMLAYIIRRIWQMIPTMLGVVLPIFLLLGCGDPAYILAGKMSNPEQIENIRQQLGFIGPIMYNCGFSLSRF